MGYVTGTCSAVIFNITAPQVAIGGGLILILTLITLMLIVAFDSL